MFCEKCGKEIEEGSQFCPNCGQKQEGSVEQTEKVQEQQEILTENESINTAETVENAAPEIQDVSKENKTQEVNQEVEQKVVQNPDTMNKKDDKKVENKPVNKLNINIKVIIAIIAGFGLCCIAFLLMLVALFTKPTINLNKYTTVEFKGYETAGKPVVILDFDKIDKKYGKKLKKKIIKDVDKYYIDPELIVGDLKSNDTSMATQFFLDSCVDGDFDINRGLSNGDKVTYKWICDEEKAKENFGVKLKYKDIEKKVTKLEKAKVFNPFDGIEVVFDGVEPDGKPRIEGEPNASEAISLDYVFDVTSGLKNGDKVKVTVTSYTGNVIDYCIEEYGKIPSPVEKEYTVKGLGSYVETINDISSEKLEEMKKQAVDVYKSEASKTWDEESKLNGLTYLGMYLLVSKDADHTGNRNELYLVYKASVNNKYSKDEDSFDKDSNIYWYISYEDIMKNPEGEVEVDVMTYKLPYDVVNVDSEISSGWFSTKSWNYKGYESLKELYDKVVTANADLYTHDEKIEKEAEETQNTEENKDESEDDSVKKEEGIVFPDSSDRLLTEEEISKLSKDEIGKAINELYARNGYTFEDETVLEYYKKYDWYNPTIPASSFLVEDFNDIEYKNVELLKKVRDN